MIDKKKVESIVSEWLADKEYFLTDLSVSEDDRIVVEIDHKDGVWIDDCVALSKYIEDRLDRNDEDYELEVGSAGIGQPFKVHRQYENHVGDAVEVVTKSHDKLRGVLSAVNDNEVSLVVKVKYKPEGAKRAKMVDKEVTLAFDDIATCQAVIDFK